MGSWLAEHPDGIAAVIAAKGVATGLGASSERVRRLTPELAKGLEFDQVVVVEPSAIVAAEPDRVTGLRRLYVCLTRAVSGLQVVHDQPLPPELAP